MRSRTEMVTTTFVDSEEDYSDDNDSEEDWRPSASLKNGKKQKCGGGVLAKKGRKRKSSSAGNKNLKRKIASEDSEDDEVNEQSEDDSDYDDFGSISGSSKNKRSSLPPKKQFSDKNSISSNDDTEDTLNLLIYVKDLTGSDLYKNNRLCLWRKDNNNLLQKYIRVKTPPDQFIFTSSSVYSSFDDKRISDFCEIKVKFVDSTNRRVKIINPSELQTLSLRDPKNKINPNDDILDGKQCDLAEYNPMFENSKANLEKRPVPKPNDDEDDEEEEVEEENDEEEDDCDLEGDDDDDIEEYDEADD